MKLRHGKCDQPGCTTPEGEVIAKTLPSSGRWCVECNTKRLVENKRGFNLEKSKPTQSHPFRKKNRGLGLSKREQAMPMLKDLISKLTSLQALFVRQKDADLTGTVICCTCDKPFHWEDVDCGHWITRGTYAIRWDLRNLAPQCRNCNRFPGENGEQPGRPEQFEAYITKKHGLCVVEELRALKNDTKFKIDRNWLIEQIKKYS